ncbi:response regulator transcription factor [Nocardioides dongxiaopingii]|uniref:helix-turn-helix transcriptional regulator n=1 Tax=Nocardioides TaxID=1839 RepID=UPI0010C766AA|nr:MULTISPECIES: response regulator transcription factor [Nocardioides]QCW51968.1 response regulator transcription factor [Nocardioides sp. S-1144]
MTSPVSTVAVVSPLDVVSAGLTAMLSHHPDRVAVVELSTGADAHDPDVILYDAVGLHQGDGADLEFYVNSTVSAVLVVSQDLRPDLAARALARGADGFFSLGVDDDELLSAVLSATPVGVGVAATSGAVGSTDAEAVGHRLGHDVGLTPREVDVLSLITQGLSNQEIAERSYLSINSVKTYIRSAYRRIGVSSRSQAVVWCLQHGFSSDRSA